MNIHGPKIIFLLPILGGIPITETILVSWLIIFLIFITIKFLTADLKKRNISSRQVIAEKIVTTVNNLVGSSMGPGNEIFAPYIATLFIFSLLSSLAGLITLRPPTAHFNVTFSWALMSFFIIEFNSLKYKGLKGYIKSFFEPIGFMFPMNVISEVAIPFSIGFRHFGNIVAGLIITQLVYVALASFSSFLLPIIGQHIPLLQVGLPAVLSVYFDLFSAFLQAFILVSLTMAYVSSAKDN